eukprot:TRINITY_DN47300_c0_g1_i1.p1 TRINITY_DN47300_c0_g1~~TRINITY_DN47300_c0_g1_i1.p1  ORF type:complete len:352 (-),score=20.47 TRINITY_DN47300_c0_g1_i1:41-1096(-)
MFKMRRKPSESVMFYHQRTAGVISEWFKHAKLLMCHQRILKTIYKAAWSEQFSPCSHRENPVELARHFRNELWWEGIRCFPRSKRHCEGLEHRHRGAQRTSWGHVLVEGLGLDWRHQRSKHKRLVDWMSGCNSFINLLCELWGLPKLPGARTTAMGIFQGALACHLRARIDSPPDRPEHPLDKNWQIGHEQVWIQVDCQAVAEIMSGCALLHNDDCEPLFRRLGRQTLQLYALQFRPLGEDFVVWSPRAYNTVADHGVNAAMDRQCSWSRVSNIHTEVCKWQLAVDRGMRDQDTAAMGVVLYAVDRSRDGKWEYVAVLRAGRELSGVPSAFVAEALALECGIAELIKKVSS